MAPNRASRAVDRYALALSDALEARADRGPWWLRGALRYYLARWDAIPDILPGIGLLDDLLILALTARAVGVSAVDPDDVLSPEASHERVRTVLKQTAARG